MTVNAEHVHMYYGEDLTTAEHVILSKAMQTLFGHTD